MVRRKLLHECDVQTLLRLPTSRDIFWLRDESLEDSANLPPPDVLVAEIIDELRAALKEFEQLANGLADKPAAEQARPFSLVRRSRQSPAMAVLGSNGTSVDTAGIRPDTTLYQTLALSAMMMMTEIMKNADTAASIRSFRMKRCAASILATPAGRFPAASVVS